MAVEHPSTAFVPAPDNPGAEPQLRVTDLKLENFDNAHYFGRVDDLRVDGLTPAERASLDQFIHTLIDKAQQLSTAPSRLGALQRLLRFSRVKLHDEKMTQEILAVMEPVIAKEVERIIHAPLQKNEEVFAHFDYQMRELFSLLDQQPPGSNVVERGMQALEEQVPLNLGDSVRTSIEHLSGQQMPQGSLAAPDRMFGELFSLPKQGNRYVLTSADGQEWYIENFFHPNQDLVTLISAIDPAKRLTVPARDLSRALETGGTDELIQRIDAKHQEEEANRETLRTYELPGDGVHLRVLPRTYDNVVSTNIASATLFSRVLKTRYPKMRILPTLYTDSPAKDMEKIVRAQYEQGQRFFLLDVYNHGSGEDIEFKEPLAAQDLTRLTAAFPDARFQLNTIACFGGGMRDRLLAAQKRGEGKNIVAFLQTQPFAPNFPGDTNEHRIPGPREEQAYSTPYYLFLMQALLEGKSYGEAHADADRNARMLISTDAEAVWNSKLFVRGSKRPTAGQTPSLPS